LHSIRLAGNKAAHADPIHRFNVHELLHNAFDLGRWLFIVSGGKQQDCPAYKALEKSQAAFETAEALKQEKRLIQEKLAANEMEMQSLLSELEITRTKTRLAEKQIEELEALLSIGKAAADVLGFDEAATRKRLIDTELVSVGWDVGTNGANTAEVTQEEEIQHQPTKTEVGYADYVLWDDNGQPLAVIEAKKTAEGAEKGQRQAELYADGLEKVHGQRPVIFYTNGFDIFIWDDGQGYPPRKIYGFYSKDSLQYLVYKRKNRMALETISPKLDIVDRIYQVEAIKRLNEKFSSNHRKGLLVQATGTGKTRVAIALTDLLNRASWVKRVLFLCDRKELRKQAKNAYNDFLAEPLTVVMADTAKDRDKRIYLATYARANNMKSYPEEGRRCWTLNYADGVQFHMDILPSIPDGSSFKLLLESRGYSNDWAEQAIAITDNTLPNYSRLDNNWPRSNPRGYAEWFKLQMKTQFETLRMAMAESFRARIEDIPEYRVKTPLQRAIQLLKRHRDIMFAQDQDDKPISIIISTLAANAYNNEANLLDALVNIVNNMPDHIQNKYGVSWVPNPVNPLENFTDKWNEHPQKERNFRYWLQQVNDDLNAALQQRNVRAVGDTLKSGFGEKVINETMKNFPSSGTGKTSALVIGKSRLPSRFSVPHRQAPIWPVQRQYSVFVSGRYKNRNGWHSFKNDSRPLPKNHELLFSAKTDVPKPFSVYWQVVNTGQQARQADQLRGEIFPSKTAGAGGLTRNESTKYKGMHWIECFIVKNNVCLARSGEFVVNIE
jgi:hypothetical protein